jgi:hypothetical protein
MQSDHSADALQLLARRGADSTLIERVRREPDAAREALRQLLVAASRGDPLAPAERLASAFAIAWGDSFHLRQVARFQQLSPGARSAKIAADSVRRAGNEALGSRGIAVALRTWRQSLRRFEVLNDSAGIAAALGNIGAGFYRAARFDSAEVYLTHA